LLEFAVKLLNRPTLGVVGLNGLRVNWVWIVRDNPVNVTVCGDYLEQSNQEGQLFEFNHDPVLEAVRRPVNGLEMEITLLTAQRHQAVVFDWCEEHHFQEGNQLEVVHAGVPTIEQHGAGLDAFVVLRRHQHLAKQVILGATIDLWRINPVVYWVEVLPIKVNQVYNVDAPYQAMFRAAVLPLHQANLLAVLLVLYAIVNDEDCLCDVVQQRLDQLPQPISRYPPALQKIADRIVAHPFQVFSQVAARIVDRCIQQIFDVLWFSDHTLDITASARRLKPLTPPEPHERKSWI
jgi:hypothetical protein